MKYILMTALTAIYVVYSSCAIATENTNYAKSWNALTKIEKVVFVRGFVNGSIFTCWMAGGLGLTNEASSFCAESMSPTYNDKTYYQKIAAEVDSIYTEKQNTSVFHEGAIYCAVLFIHGKDASSLLGKYRESRGERFHP